MANTSRTSDLLTADAIIKNGKGILMGVQMITDKTNDISLILYDNTAASGKVIFKQLVTGSDDSLSWWFGDGGLHCEDGIYADVSGTGAEFIVYWK